ncbi:VOC family protein, partial [Candidatus Curtissbacteria bacterium]|nr:VOC family protein [Candidatus Curtissbacteria bacterium]
MGRVVHFEILASDMERAVAFYKKVFAWKIDRWGDEQYALVTTGDEKKPGINGGIMPRMSYFENQGEGFRSYICTVEVDDIDEIISKVKAAGGEQV